MVRKWFISLISLVFVLGLLVQCEKNGDFGMLSDDDSDRPEWAKGDKDENDHIKGNDDKSTKKGDDYGDLYALLRDLDGVPEMIQIGEEFYVQPVGEDGTALELDGEGELVNPELATEVEFGRLSLVRSPQGVLDAGFEEAMTVIEASGAIIALDYCGRLVSTYVDTYGDTIVKTIDSPRENLAIYQYLMNNLFQAETRLAFLGEEPYRFDPLLLAASCLAAGSDKTGIVDIDEVVYTNGFMKCLGPKDEEWYSTLEDEIEREYFNFSHCYNNEIQQQFAYNRQAVYQNRFIQFLVDGTTYYPVDEDGHSDGPVFSVLEYMEDNGLFTYMWGAGEGNEELVKGFAIAVDDAVQVLELVHGDSNIRPSTEDGYGL